MLKSPNKTRFKSPHLHLSSKGLKSYKNTTNSVIIKTKAAHLMSPQQREICRRILSKPVKEEYGSLNIRFFPHLSMSKKPLQTRMGKGKGKHDKWVAPVKKGSALLEISGPVPKKVIKTGYKRISYRLPVESKLIIPKYKKNILIENKPLLKLDFFDTYDTNKLKKIKNDISILNL
jgi:large subunit ribosomal protein L16